VNRWVRWSADLEAYRTSKHAPLDDGWHSGRAQQAALARWGTNNKLGQAFNSERCRASQRPQQQVCLMRKNTGPFSTKKYFCGS
jgi:hypothetical protein